MSAGPAGPRDHLRAAAVVVYVLMVVLYALPAPGLVLNKRKFRHPVARDWFARVAGWSTAAGRPMTPAEVSDVAWSIGTDARHLRRRAVRPFAPIVERFGLQQGWHMFASAPARVGVMEVAVEQDGAWRTVYAPLRADARWSAGLLEHSRVRSYTSEFGLRRHKERLPRFTRALALRAAADHPGATALRVQMVPVQLPPAELLAADPTLPRGEPFFVTEHALSETP